MYISYLITLHVTETAHIFVISSSCDSDCTHFTWSALPVTETTHFTWSALPVTEMYTFYVITLHVTEICAFYVIILHVTETAHILRDQLFLWLRLYTFYVISSFCDWVCTHFTSPKLYVTETAHVLSHQNFMLLRLHTLIFMWSALSVTKTAQFYVTKALCDWDCTHFTWPALPVTETAHILRDQLFPWLTLHTFYVIEALCDWDCTHYTSPKLYVTETAHILRHQSFMSLRLYTFYVIGSFCNWDCTHILRDQVFLWRRLHVHINFYVINAFCDCTHFTRKDAWMWTVGLLALLRKTCCSASWHQQFVTVTAENPQSHQVGTQWSPPSSALPPCNAWWVFRCRMCWRGFVHRKSKTRLGLPYPDPSCRQEKN